MKKIFFIGAMMLTALVIFSCKRNVQDLTYKDINRLTISGDPAQSAVADSIKFSFAIQDANVQESQLNMVFRTMGPISAMDRPFKIEVNKQLSTALPEEYSLPSSLLIRAGTNLSVLPLTIKRSARLKSATAKLVVNLVETAEFGVGPKTLGAPNAGSSFTYLWTDVLTKPTTWDNGGGLIYSLGIWSQVKHRLAIESTEFKDLSVVNSTTGYYIANETEKALKAYNAANPNNPLKNEFGQVIRICASCP